MSKTYRVGIVGCGGMGRSHSRAWTSQPSTEIVAVSDINEDAAKQLAAEFSVPTVYTDYHKMFEKEALDIVSIPTWQGVRPQIAIAAANAGVKAILGEKPIADALGGANDMIEACNKNGTKLAIGHQGRFSPTGNEIRRLVANGAIGQPLVVYHRAKPNAGLLNTGTHAIDTWRYILSDAKPLWVIGQTSRTTDRWERRSRCEDLCMGLVCFENGTRGIYEGDLPDPKVPMPIIIGSEGQIKVTGKGVVPSGDVLLQNDKKIGWQEIQPTPITTNQYQELIDWLEGRIPEHRSSGQQARYTLEIMMAIFESLRIKNVVTLPLETRECPLDIMVDDGTLPVLKPGRYDLRTPFADQ